MIGKMISHYKILEKLKQDETGATYKAEDTKLKRMVTLQLLSEQFVSQPELKTKLLGKFQAFISFNHPNIAPIYEIGQADGKYFISSAYLEGKSLKSVLKEKILFLDQILQIAILIAEGLKAAHQKNILHLDLGPNSIILTKKGMVKIIDFGVAEMKRAFVSQDRELSLETGQYLSPEQVQGNEVDSRSDLFSFGVVLYEMITRHRPFKGEDRSSIADSILHDSPKPLATYRKDLPDELQTITSKLLEKERNLRYQNADEVLVDLKRLKQKLIAKRPIILRKVRPRYKKALIFALIISFIIAVILICIMNKYLFKPIFERKGSLDRKKPVVVVQYGDIPEERTAPLHRECEKRKKSFAWQFWRET